MGGRAIAFGIWLIVGCLFALWIAYSELGFLSFVIALVPAAGLTGLYFFKSRHFVPVFVNLTVVSISTSVLHAIGAGIHSTGGVLENAVGILAHLASLAYIFLSRRIQVTFRRKVVPNDLHFVWDKIRADMFLEYGWDRIGSAEPARGA